MRGRSFYWKPVSMVFVCFVALAPLGLAEEGSRKKHSFPIQDLFEDSAQVETVADSLEYSKEDRTVIAKGNVVITYGEDKITSDYAEVKQDTKKAFAKGHVIIFRNDEARAKGKEVHYDFNNKTGSFPHGTLLTGPWNCKGAAIDQVKEGVVAVEQGRISTCKGDNPPYEIRAKKITFHTDDKLIAQNVTIYTMGKPIFWWPYMVVPLRNRSFPLSVNAGYRSEHGAIIELSKGIAINKYMSGKLHGDWRSKRGFGTGGDLDYSFGPLAQGQIRGYWTQDEEAPAKLDGERDYSFARTEQRDRGRISLRHRSDFDEYTHGLVRYERVADEFFLQDFFEKEHRAEVEPQSFFTVSRDAPRYGVMVHGTKRMNKFESLVERIPEVRLSWKNQPFFHPRVFYENETSYTSLTKVFGRTVRDEDVQRADHISEWSLPFQFEGIKFTPFAHFRNTYYSRERESDNDHYRILAGGGLDVRTQLYKTFDTSADFMGIEINQLRHVFEPSINYLGQSSSVSDEKLDHFDSIDKLDDEQRVTFGLENRIQTKRVVNGRMKRVDLVSLNTFLRYQVHPDVGSNQSRFDTLSQEIVLRPYEWLQYQARIDYDMKRDTFRSFTQDLIARTRKFLFLFGHRYIDNDHISDRQKSNNQLVFDGRWLISPLWRAGGYVRFNSEDQELEEWQLSALRNFGCVILEFGYNVRNSSIRSSNKELFFKLWLTDFPDYTLRGGGARASFSPPRIGETIAGSNERRGGLIFEEQNLGILGK